MISSRAILMDIEGTTSSISFVRDVLFPYSRSRIARYAAAHATQLAPVFDAVRKALGASTIDDECCVTQLLAWHDADVKIAPLKVVQGRIWAEGYAQGELKGHVYADAVDAWRQWKAAGVDLYIFSSGSAEAQALLFSHTEYGDLTPLLSGYFDTTIGSKLEASSYECCCPLKA